MYLLFHCPRIVRWRFPGQCQQCIDIFQLLIARQVGRLQYQRHLLESLIVNQSVEGIQADYALAQRLMMIASTADSVCASTQRTVTAVSSSTFCARTFAVVDMERAQPTHADHALELVERLAIVVS